jgi:hypothetical protein
MQLNMNILFIGLALVIGVILMIASAQIDTALRDSQSSCNTTRLQNCNRGLLIISVLLLCLGIGYIGTNFYCECPGTKVASLVYSGVILAIGIVILVLAGIIRSEASDCNKIKEKLTLPNVLGGILTALAATHIGIVLYSKNFEKLIGGKGGIQKEIL